MPLQAQIACPYCWKQTTELEKIIFKDVDKSKPIKFYTDSPHSTIVSIHQAEIYEELKVRISEFDA
jgi:hypothetical protein